MTSLVRKFKDFLHVSPVARKYMTDGLLVLAAVNFAAANNNLYALRLGADDYQLSMVQSLPMIFNLLILLPGGFIINSLKNKKNLVMQMLLISAAGYFLCGLAPFFPAGGNLIYVFLGFLSFGTGMVAIYNISWQSFFPDVVDIRSRNQVFALRTQVSTFTGMVIPLITGVTLSFIPTGEGKIFVHQIFYFISAGFFIAGAWNFRRIQAVKETQPRRVTVGEIKNAGKSILVNKQFLFFMGVALFFYMGWHLDWTLYYIGQVQYLKLNEFLLGLVTVFGTAAQLLTLRFWSRKNEKLGVVLPIVFGILGLSLCPIVMIVSVSLPGFIGPYAFLLLNTAANLPFITINLNMFQCQLQVIDEQYRSITLSVFSTLTCLSNAVMPLAGVALYRFLGADIDALRNTFWIFFVFRLASAGLWLWRWKVIEKNKVR